MKITFLTSHFPEISEQFIINQIIGLIDEGVDVSIITLHNSDGQYKNPEFVNYNLEEKIINLSIPKENKKRLISAIPKILKLLVLSPIKLLTGFNILRYNRAVYSLKTVYALDALRNHKFDLLHCHFGPNGVVGSYLKDIGIAKSFITTYHGSDINSYPLRHGKSIYKYLFKRCNSITVNTTFTGNKVVGYGAERSKITIIPVGLRCIDYPYIKKDFDYSKIPVILTVARLEEKKGINYALESMVLLIKKYPDAVYHIAGSGSLKDKMKKLALELGVERNVIFHGFCDRKKIFNLYEISTVFLLPSVTASNGDMEGQGLVLQEAQAVGLPVISTLHNGIPDGVVDNKTGFLVPERDIVAIVEKISYLTENPEIAKKFGEQGRKFVLSNYDIPKLTKKLLSIYHESTLPKP